MSLFVVGLGCQTTSGRRVAGEESESKIRADAYAFNARLWRGGKPTTFKLELYHTDNRVGMAGRGYLGKGALKGWLSSDSIRIYFPSTNEYLYESLDDLVSMSDCPTPLAGLDLLELFSNLPDSTSSHDKWRVSADYEDVRKPKFVLRPRDESCGWQVELDYVRQGSGWVVERFLFDDGQELVFKAVREKYQAGALVPQKRFEVTVPDDAIKITP